MNTPPEDSARFVVYTALFGDYERLVEQPIARSSGAKFVCFTDNPALTSDSWEVRVVTPTLPWDSTRMARKSKIVGYREFPNAEATLWIDNRVVLRSAPEEIIGLFLKDDVDLALPSHSHRDSVRDEFNAVIAAGFDEPWRVREQLHYLTQHSPEVLDEKPLWTAIIARYNNPRVHRAMDVWLDLVMRHSRRDQLSVNYALREAGVISHVIEVDNLQSDFHEWLRIGSLPKRKEVLFSRGWSYSIRRHVADAILTSRLAIYGRTRLRMVLARLS